ncbi:MAG: hypothetical protein NW220_16170 [Leptolyngbyaceae cyanobacterium bins.349]|nr:hypothetical protein [Leptolyngbyaceae cyanobacterium bins.349]
MLLVALGVHGFLLFFPWQSQSAKQAAEQADGKSVKLTRLTTLKQAKPDAKQSEAAEAALRSANQSEIVVKASPSPSPSPVVKSTQPSPVPVARRPAKTPTPAPAPAKATPPAKANDATALLTQQEQVFVSRLQKLEGREVDEQVSSTLFSNPEDFYKDPVKELGKPGIVGIEYVSFQRPEAVYQQLVQLYPDYKIAAKGEYGGGPVYEMRKGEFVRHLNLVRAKLGAGTLVILWQRSPI